MLHDKITLSSSGNTARWIFYGTRKEILDWMHEHTKITVEASLFTGGRPTSFHTCNEIVIDLQAIPDAEQSYYDYFKSFFVSDYERERVKVELRPRMDSKDAMILTQLRIIVRSGVCFGDIVEELQHEWYKPARSYYRQAVDLFNDNPGPCHVVSADAPSSIKITEQEQDKNQPAANNKDAHPEAAAQ